MNECSSIGTCMEEEGSQKQEQAQKEEVNFEAELTKSSKVVRKFSLDSHRAIEEVRGNSDLEGFEDDSQTVGNGTVTKSSKEKINGDNAGTDQEQKKEANEPWVNMFKNNRVASNRMQLSYEEVHNIELAKCE